MLEAMDDGRTGWALKSENATDFSDKILQILDSRDIMETARNDGPSFVKAKFDMDRMIQQTMDIYNL